MTPEEYRAWGEMYRQAEKRWESIARWNAVYGAVVGVCASIFVWAVTR